MIIRCLRRVHGPRSRILQKPSQRQVLKVYPRSHMAVNVNNRELKRFLSTVPGNPNLDNDHLRNFFYPNDEDPHLIAICESASMQQVFDVYTSIPADSLKVRHSAQALAALWDIQKFMFGIGHLFDPSETEEFQNRLHYVTTLRDHPVLQEIVRHIVENRKELEDEPLAVALLCLGKLKFGVKNEQAQLILEELLARKTTLNLPALSRVFVSMRHESIYGAMVMSEFFPTLYTQIETMETEKDVQLVSIALRSAKMCITSAMQNKYLERLDKILEENRVEFEVTTLCKIIAYLFDVSFHYIKVKVDEMEGVEKVILASELSRKVCNLLEPRVSEMDTMNILTLSKVVDFAQEPVNFLNAVHGRTLELAEIDRNIELMSTIQPKTLSQQIKLARYLENYLDNCTYFDKVNFLVFRILKKLHFDPNLSNTYWSKVTEVLVSNEARKDMDGVEYSEYFEEDTSTDFNDDYVGLSNGANNFKRKFLIFAHEYINFRRGTCRTYRHPEFEEIVTRMIYPLMRDYDLGKVILVPKDYAKCVAFLFSLGKQVQIRISFLENFRIDDLILIQKGVELFRKSNTSKITSILSKRSQQLLSPHLKALDYSGLAKLNLKYQTQFEFNPTFKTCMNLVTTNEFWDDSRISKELLSLMIRSGFYLPEALERVGTIICKLENEISVVVAERFLWASFLFGVDGIKGVVESARICLRNLDNLHPLPILESALSLSFLRCLDKEMVGKIFCVDFLDEVDNYIKATNAETDTPRRLRDIFMELNRAVCLDMPEANIPWFHQKYCEEMAAAVGFPNGSYLHNEVGMILADRFGSGNVASKTYSPYFYPIDFLVELDECGQPMKVSSKPTSQAMDGTRIAIIIQRPKDFTSNVRKLKGRHVLKKRHLEIMGYRVISIDPNKWNSMYMSEKSAKSDYLEACIFN